MGRSSVAVVALSLWSLGCGPSEADVSGEAPSELSSTGDELSSASRSYVTLRKDTRKCMAPLCGGWYVADVNRASLNEQYVSALDFTSGGVSFDARVEAAVLGAGDGEVVLRGKLGAKENTWHTRKFVVSDAWRGLPGVRVAQGDVFNAVAPMNLQCIVAPCPSVKVSQLNSTKTVLAHGLTFARAAKPFVDLNWLESRVLGHGALVASRLSSGQTYAGGTEKLVDASQVLIHLPETVGPCPMRMVTQCPSGQVHTGVRTADRCVVPTACVLPAMCSKIMVACEAGYTMSSWAQGVGACPSFACDPTFVLQ